MPQTPSMSLMQVNSPQCNGVDPQARLADVLGRIADELLSPAIGSIAKPSRGLTITPHSLACADVQPRQRVDRSVGAVRSRKGIVDVNVSEFGKSAREIGRVRFFLFAEAKVFERATCSCRSAETTRFASSPMQSSAKTTALPPIARLSGATRCRREKAGSLAPFGRPKCDITTTLAPPSRRVSIVQIAILRGGIVLGLHVMTSANFVRVVLFPSASTR